MQFERRASAHKPDIAHGPPHQDRTAVTQDESVGSTDTRRGFFTPKDTTSRSSDPWEGVEAYYHRLVPSARRMAYLITSDTTTADDAVHDAFLKVMAKRTHIKHPGALQQYMHKAVLNEIRSHQRSMFRRRARQEKYARTQPQTTTIATGSQHKIDISHALNQLPRTQREVLVMSYFLDYPDTTIAETLSKPLGTIKSTKSRALAQLRKIINHD